MAAASYSSSWAPLDSILESPVDVLQIDRRVQVLVDGLADHVAIGGIGVTATAIGLHVVVVDDRCVGQERGVLVQVQVEAVVERVVAEELVPAAVAAVQVLLDVELFGHEAGQVFRLDVAHVQHRLVVGDELGLDESAVRGVQLVVERRHQIINANQLLDLVPVPVQIQSRGLEDLLGQLRLQGLEKG